MYLLDGAIRNYAWGSHQELAALRGAPTPTEHPEAEMWFGTHTVSYTHLTLPTTPYV